MAPPLSDAVKADYLEAMLLLDHPPLRLVNQVVEDFKGSSDRTTSDPPLPRQRSHQGRGNDGFEGDGDRFRRYLPDLQAQVTYYPQWRAGAEAQTARAARWPPELELVHCDEPISVQFRTMSDLNLFSGPPNAPGMLAAPELVSELDRAGPARHVLPRWTDLQKPLSDERSRQAKLVVVIAGELYLREHGKRPASAQELIWPLPYRSPPRIR